jgi:hypothetical protein
MGFKGFCFALVLVLASLPAAVFSGEGYGKLRVNTDPPGADVVIVAELGKTPLANDFINPGLYRIEIRHPGGKYLAVAAEVAFADGQPVTLNHTLTKPPVFTKRRGIQLALGVGAAAGFVWAIVDTDRDRRIAAAAAGGVLQTALIVTIFIN